MYPGLLLGAGPSGRGGSLVAEPILGARADGEALLQHRDESLAVLDAVLLAAVGVGGVGLPHADELQGRRLSQVVCHYFYFSWWP